MNEKSQNEVNFTEDTVFILEMKFKEQSTYTNLSI